ncbi:putative RNA polymerase II subunit B1 CTD phosphatase RPAP2 isoform X2 [Gigantopelta aegis]|uniref:putative RNA polymerase II subunit B1 CTD phosphatase RPAP2 isoform X2 n=1 Tax=Gigantopelta aegis TaxID=1735272 RepID=UPI001B88CD74|nr:putative RNA polymerase II subunit B1 CTD phosphatase RPAP2 isoform X2 [Gigantopelta aegis]
MEQKKKVEESVRKRVAAEERAFNVILRLIDEPAVTENYLADAGQMISPDNYSDVTEERAITKLCGYPLCGTILESIPKQKYHISTRSNKVYEISDRKNFCSSRCYQASKHFAQQISKSPVWARENIPRIQFTFLAQQKTIGLIGEEVFRSPKEVLAREIERLKALDELSERTNEDGLDKKDRKHHKEEDTEGEGREENSDTDKTNKCLTAASIVGNMALLTLQAKQTQSDLSQMSEPNVPLKQDGEMSHPVDGETSHPVDGETPHPVDGETPHPVDGETPHPVDGEMSHPVDSEMSHPVDSETPNPVDDEMSHPVEVAETSYKDVGKNVECSNTQMADKSVRRKLSGLKEKSHQNKDSDKDKGFKNSNIQTIELRATEENFSVKESSQQTEDFLDKPLPGESNSDFVLRLLDKRKHLLSKMADIQQMVPVNENKPQTKKPDVLENISSNKSSWGNVLSNADAVRQCHVKSAAKSKVKKSKQKQLSLLNYIGKMVEQWMTRESLEYLDKHRVAKTELKSSDPEVQQHYLRLMKRAEATEKLMDSDDDDDEEVPSPMKPVPDFKKLKEETEQFQNKVASFFKGSQITKAEGKQESSESNRIVYLPTVDSQDQLQIRRKIVLDRLSKVVPDLLTPLKLTMQDITKELREIVYTFRFDNKNILFKPAEWTLVTLILFRLLSVKLRHVEEAFKRPSFVHFCGVLLEGIGHTKEDIDSIVDQLVDKDYDSLDTLHTLTT